MAPPTGSGTGQANTTDRGNATTGSARAADSVDLSAFREAEHKQKIKPQLEQRMGAREGQLRAVEEALAKLVDQRAADAKKSAASSDGGSAALNA